MRVNSTSAQLCAGIESFDAVTIQLAPTARQRVDAPVQIELTHRASASFKVVHDGPIPQRQPPPTRNRARNRAEMARFAGIRRGPAGSCSELQLALRRREQTLTNVGEGHGPGRDPLHLAPPNGALT